MRLLTYDRGGEPRLGLLSSDHVIDVADAGGGSLPSEMLAFLDRGEEAVEAARHLQGGGGALALTEVRLLAPIPRPARNIVCVGLNYAEHAAESRVSQGLPEVPVFFTKPPSTVIGPDAPIPLHPALSTRIDWEVELAVVIAKRGRDIPEEDALDYVFGYTVANDVTARDLQARHQQWYKGKGLDGFCPLGPWIVTKDEIPDPQALHLSLRVDGDTKQSATTNEMIFSVTKLIASWSLGMTVEPGDLLLTGTPSGVGFARKPPEYLRPGNVVEAEVAEIGVLRNSVASH